MQWNDALLAIFQYRRLLLNVFVLYASYDVFVYMTFGMHELAGWHSDLVCDHCTVLCQLSTCLFLFLQIGLMLYCIDGLSFNHSVRN